MSDDLRQSHTSAPSRSGSRHRASSSAPGQAVAAAASGNPLQLVIQRLQGECELLRSEKRELERKLQQEVAKGNRMIAETNDIQRHLMVENQKLSSDAGHLKDKVREYQATLELAHERIKQVDASERQAALRCEVLEDTVRELEAMTARQRQSMEFLEQDVERLNELVAQLGDERDQVLERTEADAKRVRTLWEETMAQHKAERTAMERAVDKARRESRALQTSVAQKDEELTDIRAKLTHSKLVETQDTQKIEALERQVRELKGSLAAAQTQHTQVSQSLQTVALQVEEQASKLRWTEEKLHDVTQHREDDRREASARQEELQRTLEELDVLKSEFAAALDAHEETIAQLRGHVYAKTSVEERLQVELDAEKKHAATMATLLNSHIGDYNRILCSVDHKLTDMRECLEVTEASPPLQPLRAARRPTQGTSLSIFAH
ncbi:Aste57867_20005 [Aphanomyces stellatus]|uniref:Aste57867_20005 protein n=1 Tax=Aphanomyces stellatus TaxID=120398 RepID=A0A485LFW1_9STRA|nr:hypothetical protein As57867_019939 [Aphanomyces stellatus]VFT96702.1 Aste57867_20005 [Aphanomyces stellatus]